MKGNKIWNVVMLTNTVSGKRYCFKTSMEKENIFGNIRSFQKIVNLANDIKMYGWERFSYIVLEKKEDGFEADCVINTIVNHFLLYSTTYGYNKYKKNPILDMDYKRKLEKITPAYTDIITEEFLNIEIEGKALTSRDFISDEIRYGKQIAVEQLNLDWVSIKKFKSLTEAANTLSIDKGNISKSCKNHLYTAGGYRWRFCNPS